MWTELERDLFWLLREYSKILYRIEYFNEYDLDVERTVIHKEIAKLLQCDQQSLVGVLHNFPREDGGFHYHIPRALGILIELKNEGLLL